MKTLFQFTLVTLAIGIPITAVAQQRDQEQGRWTGKLKGVVGGVLQVESDKGEQWLVSVAPRAQEISFQGTATPAFIRAGMLVQFNAAIDKKGEAQDSITEIKVISPRMGVQPGLQPGGNAGAGLFNSNDDDGNKKKKKVRADVPSYTVTGTVRSIKDGKMYVSAGATVKAELSDNCQVNLDISDISFAREGDAVEVNGWRYVNQANQLYARRLVITADKTIGAEEKKRRPTKDEKKTEEKAEEKKSEKKKSEEKSPPKEK